MQRAAGGTPTNSTPNSAPPHKRRRTEFGSGLSTPSRSMSTHSLNPTESQDGQLSRTPTNPGAETAWVLKSTVSQINEHNDSDSSSEDELWSSKAPMGRQTFGSFKKRKAVPVSTKRKRDDADADLSSASEEGEISDDELPPDHHSRVMGHAAKKAVGPKQTDTASPLRAFAEKQDRKKKQREMDAKRKKMRRTM
jgi:hypothetical protein